MSSFANNSTTAKWTTKATLGAAPTISLYHEPQVQCPGPSKAVVGWLGTLPNRGSQAAGKTTTFPTEMALTTNFRAQRGTLAQKKEGSFTDICNRNTKASVI